MYKFGKRSLERLSGVHPAIVAEFSKALEHKDCPHDIGIPQLGGLRTTKDQQGLFAIGRSKDKGKSIVTKVDGVARKSNHQAKEDGYGYAVDIYIYEGGKASWDKLKIEQFARHLQRVSKLDISWGGDWKWKDRPHFEVTTGLIEVKKAVKKVPVKKTVVPKKKAPAKRAVAKKKPVKRKK